MKLKAVLLSLAVSLSLGLTACGGGGSDRSSAGSEAEVSSAIPGASGAPAPAPPASEAALAAASALSFTYDAEAKRTVLSWNNNFPAGTTYSVQVLGQDGNFQSVAELTASGSLVPPGGAFNWWYRATPWAHTFRVRALQPSSTTDLLTVDGQPTLVVPAPVLPPPAIVLDQVGPLSGSVQLSVSGAPQGTTVSNGWSI